MTIAPDTRIAIHQRAARTSIGRDSEDAAGFAAPFAEDGVVVAPRAE